MGETNFIHNIIEKDLESHKYGDKVCTRFPPEPNGYLHIGHAKSICLNFSTAAKYGGTCNLRYDDTNPVKEDDEYINSIEEDVKWLGFRWDKRLWASDYFDKMYEAALELIKKGKAYVCDLTPEEIKEYRGTLTQPGKESPYRNRSVEENLALFEEMKEGRYADGEKVLRAKIDMASPNINMRDPIIYRIAHATHHNTGDKWCIYPMYDFAHPIEDAILELLALGLQRADHVLHLQDAHVVVARVGMDQQGILQLLGMPDGRTTLIFLQVASCGLSDVVGGGKQLPIVVGRITHTHHDVAHGHARKAASILTRIGEQVHQRNHTAVAPPHDADAVRIHDAVVLDHVVAADKDIFVLQASVVDVIIGGCSITRAATILRRDNNVALRNQLAHDVGIIGVEIGMHPAMRQHHQRVFLALIDAFRDEDVSPKLQLVASTHAIWIGLFPTSRAAEIHLVDVGQVANFLLPKQVVYFLQHLVELMLITLLRSRPTA